MVIDARIEESLAGAAAVDQLRSLAISLQREGQSQDSILDFFDQARKALGAAGREADEDAVLEVMDFLVGWCSPHMDLSSERP